MVGLISEETAHALENIGILGVSHSLIEIVDLTYPKRVVENISIRCLLCLMDPIRKEILENS
jgi:hypothetical protein